MSSQEPAVSPSKKQTFSFYSASTDLTGIMDTSPVNDTASVPNGINEDERAAPVKEGISGHRADGAENSASTLTCATNENERIPHVPMPPANTGSSAPQPAAGSNGSAPSRDASELKLSESDANEAAVLLSSTMTKMAESQAAASAASAAAAPSKNATEAGILSKEDAINQLLLICAQKGIDVPNSVRSTLIHNDEASALSFTLSKMVAGDADDASIAESVSTFITSSGLNATMSSSTIADVSSVGSRCAAHTSTISCRNSGDSGASGTSGAGNSYSTPTKPTCSGREHDAKADEGGAEEVVNASFASTTASSPSTMSRRGRGCGIMLADAGDVPKNGPSRVPSPRKTNEATPPTRILAQSFADDAAPIKADPMPHLHLPVLESPPTAAAAAASAAAAAAAAASPASSAPPTPYTPDNKAGSPSDDILSRTPESFGSTVDTSFSSSGRVSPVKTPVKKEKQSTAAGAGARDLFHSDNFDENEQSSKSRLPSSQRIKLVLALILIIGGVAGIIFGGSEAAKQKRAGTGTANTTNFEDPTSAPTTRSLPITAAEPTRAPTKADTSQVLPTARPTQAPTITDPNEYIPGHLTQMKLGVRLSNGLGVRVIATSRSPVKYENGKSSGELPFHERPDFGATFPIPKSASTNRGGWVYVSNSEIEKVGSGDDLVSSGGVGKITFNRKGNVIGYEMILQRTDRNCGGGTTPWQTFISCEESRKEPPVGHCFQVDPFAIGGNKKSLARTVLGGTDGGSFESFAHDVRNRALPRFFVTEDMRNGALRRFTPSVVDWENPSQMLHDKNGTLEYLLLEPADDKARNGTFTWIANRKRAGRSAMNYYPNSEGIDVANGILYFVSKTHEDLFVVDLDNGTYERKVVQQQGIDVSPDQLVRLGGDNGILYLTEDGGEHAGIHGRDAQGRYFTILESPIYKEETTGLAFSPNKRHMYLAYQKNGILLDVWRKDGKKFDGAVLNTKYHTQEESVTP